MLKNEFLDPFTKMLEVCSPPDAVRAIENGASLAVMWDAVEQSGFLQSLVAEEHDGFGLVLHQIAPLLVALGSKAVPLPVAETMVVRALLAATGAALVAGPITMVCHGGDGAALVPFGMVSDYALHDDGERLALVDLKSLERQPTGVRASLDAYVYLANAEAEVTIDRP